MAAALLLLALAPRLATAHIQLYFVPLQFARTFTCTTTSLTVDFQCRFPDDAPAGLLRAGSPTARLLDLDRDGKASQPEVENYAAESAQYLRLDAAAFADGAALAGRTTLTTPTAASGAASRFEIRCQFLFPPDLLSSAQATSQATTISLRFLDPASLLRPATAPRADALRTDSLTSVGIIVLQSEMTPTGAAIDLLITSATAVAAAPGPPAAAAAERGVAYITGRLGQATTSPAMAAVLLLLSFALGALHALQPGHGKTIVASYLIGSGGRLADAVVLGLTVTVTHVGIIGALAALALGVLSSVAGGASTATLMPWLTIASGVLVAGLGADMLRSHLNARAATPAAAPWAAWLTGADHVHCAHCGGHHPTERHTEFAHQPDTPAPHAHPHQHPHAQTAAPRAPLRFASLLALGISGGLVPCPDALVILLAAIALGHFWFGLAIVAAFSAGLAAVLVSLGVLLVLARPWFERRTRPTTASARWLRRLPLAASVFILMLGLLVVLRGWQQLPA